MLRSLNRRIKLVGSFFVRLLLFFTIFFCMIQFLNRQTYSLLERSFEASLADMCVYTSQNAASSLNRIFYEVYQTNYLIGMDQQLQNLFSSYRPLNGRLQEYPDIISAIRTLRKVPQISDYIENVAIYKKDSEKVINTAGLFNADEFFDMHSRYSTYGREFWQSFDMGTVDFQILEPCEVQVAGAVSPVKVLPIVQSKIFDYKSRNLYIINLDLGHIESVLDSYKPTANSLIWVADDQESGFIAHSSLPADTDIANFLELATVGQSSSHVMVGADKYLLLKHDSNFFFKQVKVVTCVPQSDIRSMVMQSRAQRLLMTTINILIAVAAIVFFSRQAYAPLKELIVSIAPAEHKFF